MEQLVVEAQKRTPGGKNANRRLRKLGKIPAVVYGSGKEPLALSVDPYIVTDILHSESGHNTIFSINVEGEESPNVMVKEYQLDPVKGDLIHADFFQIAMDRILTLSVGIEITGEAEGVKVGGGIMDIISRSIDIECLPANIPDSIKVDVTHLNINDHVRVKDLPQNPDVKILTDSEVVIVTVIPPIKEEVVEEAPVEDAAEPEVIKRGKTDEETPGKAPEDKTNVPETS